MYTLNLINKNKAILKQLFFKEIVAFCYKFIRKGRKVEIYEIYSSWKIEYEY